MDFKLNKTVRGFSDDEMLADLRNVAKRLGRDTVTIAEYTEHGMGHASSLQRRFGSWFKALDLAGLQPSRSKIGISDDELFDNIKNVWLTLGRQPSYTEIKKPLSKFSAGTYENRFGGWSRALQGFVHWVNIDERGESTADTGGDQISVTPIKPKRRTRREISERLRFRILVRDGFVCQSCGASPLKSPGVELHVDHIVPWSKGGETVIENLNTKCSRCNLGKGNEFEA